MTPVVKAMFTDFAFENANRGLQVYGGHGYIRDHGVEQYVRDARIAMIYEGTNGIQALDLVGRKLGAHAGRYLRSFFHPVAAFIEANRSDDAAIGEYVKRLEKAFGALQLATGQIAQSGMRDPEEAGAAATDLPAPVRAGRARLSMGANGEDRRRQGADGQRRRVVLQVEARHRALLLRPHLAGDRGALRRDQVRQGLADGDGRGGVLTRYLGPGSQSDPGPWLLLSWLASKPYEQQARMSVS